MQRSMVIALVAAVSLATGTSSSIGEPLLGKNYVGASFSFIQFGDDLLDEILGTGYGLSVFGNRNLGPNTDLFVSGGRNWADGNDAGIEVDLSSTYVGGDIIHFLSPSEPVNPYFHAGLTLVEAEVELSGPAGRFSTDDSEIGFGLGGGIEFDTTENVTSSIGISYFNIDSEDSIGVGGFLAYWFNETVVSSIGGSYDLDDNTAVAALTLRTIL